MREQQALETLRFRYRHKFASSLLTLVIALGFGAFCVHAAISGMEAPLRGFQLLSLDPALFWWSGAAITGGLALVSLRAVFGAFGPGRTITLTEDNLIFSGRSSTDRERIPYRSIEHARCVDVSTTSAVIVIRYGRSEKQLASPAFESLPDFYAFWSALQTRLKPAVVQGTDPEGFEQHGSTRRAVESLTTPKHWIMLGCIVLAVFVIMYIVEHLSPAVERPVTAASSAPRPAPPGFVYEALTTSALQREYMRLGLQRPLRIELQAWVVDRQRQAYFVVQGGGHGEIPNQFALVLPREGVTVQVEGWLQAQGPVQPGGLELDWDITSVRAPKVYSYAAPRYLELVRQALQAYGYYGDPTLTREIRVKLPAPSFR